MWAMQDENSKIYVWVGVAMLSATFMQEMNEGNEMGSERWIICDNINQEALRIACTPYISAPTIGVGTPFPWRACNMC